MIDHALMRQILDGFPLPILGVHGLGHWARVLENGLRLADRYEANRDVVKLFAVFHDSRRRREHRDDGHGMRGAELALELRADYLDLRDEEFDLLVTACAHHTDGKTEADITVQCCWDADRLDLRRIGMMPRDELLCTPAARNKDMKLWATKRSESLFVPEIVHGEWMQLVEGNG